MMIKKLAEKKEIMIAILLVSCLLLATAVMLFVENKVGVPLFFDGEMKNIRVKITEVCAANKSIIATDNGDFPDYIELYNEGETFNLADFGLAKDESNGIAYSFGAGTLWGWCALGSLIGVGPFIFLHKLCKSMNLLCADYNARG